jgi:EAL domain-containing protein (putative c-di-GMP-specific phosphodiesterase class I)
VDASRTIRGCESLIRWNHPEFGFIPPPRFIPIAERTGDIRILGRWILYKSCLQLKAWHEQGFPDMFVSVNLSPVQFLDKDLVSQVSAVMDGVGIEGRHLKLEITEGAIMSHPEDSIRKLQALRALGIRISIDDFGTGYSSLNYLAKLPIDTLKIDKSFIDDVTRNIQNQEIVRAIISMADSLKIETLAEGVETAEQKDMILAEGCKYIQGYFFSKPVDADQYTDYLRNGAILPVGRD